ncbi:hypothetical protein F5H01DRAFT_374459 [Linnemannia elongata]|nr:hypothetical protein F5H01DRAFT_374459 [Linnemannia elongata]
MRPFQRFRLHDLVLNLAIRQDDDGPPYSQLTDVQEAFPGAMLFKLDDIVLNFLEDESKKKYEPKRIAHYPDDIIDIIAGPVPAPPFPHTISSALVPATSPPLSSLCDLTNLATLQTTSIVRPIAMLSTMARDITQLQQQLEHSTDQQSVYHQQQMQQLINMVQQQNDMVAQQNELVRQQNVMLQEQAASKEREERMLQEQAESRIKEEQMLKMQQETIDRLIVNQQRVDALLVQNYELHEYPIPRLFVVLPDSFSDWDPRNFLMERFRLYFLCECGGNCGSDTGQSASSEQPGIDATMDTKPIPVKNSIHLAKHEGYELSRPTEFFDQYGPYILGILRILQHCLTIAAMATPVAALADSGLKDVMDGVKSISESTIEAVDMSINILESKLGDADRFATIASDGHDNTMFENLAALEGADLRRLDTFLRNNDQDKILGNLYRITTEQGHVKWVCFDHYQEKYRATALASFVQSVETGGGSYDPHLGQVTISLNSGTTSKDFFRRLATQAPAAQSLDVTLDWAFGSADLVTLVDMVSKSNVKVVKLDLKDDYTSNAIIASLRPGKGRYHSLLGLLSNTKLRSLQLSNLYLLGTRTSNLPSNFNASWLQSFSFYGRINEEDQFRLANITSHCSQLVVLRLVTEVWCSMGLSLQQAVFSLKKLQRLHTRGLHIDQDSNVNDVRSMKIFYYTAFRGFSKLTKTIRQSGPVLEVLILESSGTDVDIVPADLSPIPLLGGREGAPVEPLSRVFHLSALTHLDLSVPLTDPSLLYLSTILPSLDLVHFGCNHQSRGLLQHCNLASLKSLSIKDTEGIDLNFPGTMGDETAGLTWDGLEQLYIRNATPDTKIATHFLQSTPLTRLYLDYVDSKPLTEVLEVVNLSKLQELSIHDCGYSPEAEQALARRTYEFTESLVIRLDDPPLCRSRRSERYEGRGDPRKHYTRSKTRSPRTSLQLLKTTAYSCITYAVESRNASKMPTMLMVG